MAENAVSLNKLGRTLTARQQGTGALTIQLNGGAANSTVAAANVAGETVQALFIEKILWSGNCSVARAANVIWSGASGTAGILDLYGNGMTNKEYPTANVVITVNDGGSCFVLIGKQSLYTSTY